jgi:hypothetical protein
VAPDRHIPGQSQFTTAWVRRTHRYTWRAPRGRTWPSRAARPSTAGGSSGCQYRHQVRGRRKQLLANQGQALTSSGRISRRTSTCGSIPSPPSPSPPPKTHQKSQIWVMAWLVLMWSLMTVLRALLSDRSPRGKTTLAPPTPVRAHQPHHHPNPHHHLRHSSPAGPHWNRPSVKPQGTQTCYPAGRLRYRASMLPQSPPALTSASIASNTRRNRSERGAFLPPPPPQSALSPLQEPSSKGQADPHRGASMSSSSKAEGQASG